MPRVKKNKNYFGNEEEKAVVDYINAKTQEEKNLIYNKYLKQPFDIMIQSILRLYPTYIGGKTMEEVEGDALVHLLDKMVIFDENMITKKGNKTKAYSYCQTIVRNYFRDYGRKTYGDLLKKVDVDDVFDDIQKNNDFIYDIDSDDDSTENNFIPFLINKLKKEIDNNYEDLTENELNVGYAIINVLDNWDILFMEYHYENHMGEVSNKYAKNKILLFIKEQTNLNTVEIRNSMKKYVELYDYIKNIFYD